MSFSRELSTFLVRHAGAFRLAIVGGTDAHRAAQVTPWLQAILGPLRDEQFLVITGGTGDGVPGVAAHVAHAELGFPILGVIPERGQEYVSSEFLGPESEREQTCLVTVPPAVRFPPPVGTSMWGDESPLLVQLADAMLVIGGEWGTTVEVALAMKVNARRLKYRQPLIRIVPVNEFPGPAQMLADAPWMTDALHRSFPLHPRSGYDAITRYLRELLPLPRYRP